MGGILFFGLGGLGHVRSIFGSGDGVGNQEPQNPGGPPGSPGTAGEDGIDGDVGATGAEGAAGPQGPAGTPGAGIPPAGPAAGNPLKGADPAPGAPDPADYGLPATLNLYGGFQPRTVVPSVKEPRLGHFIDYSSIGSGAAANLARLYYPTSGPRTVAEQIAAGERVAKSPTFTRSRIVSTRPDGGTHYTFQGSRLGSTTPARGTQAPAGGYLTPLARSLGLGGGARTSSGGSVREQQASKGPSVPTPPSPRRPTSRRTPSRGGTSGSVARSIASHTGVGTKPPRPSSNPLAAYQAYRRRYGR